MKLLLSAFVDSPSFFMKESAFLSVLLLSVRTVRSLHPEAPFFCFAISPEARTIFSFGLREIGSLSLETGRANSGRIRDVHCHSSLYSPERLFLFLSGAPPFFFCIVAGFSKSDTILQSVLEGDGFCCSRIPTSTSAPPGEFCCKKLQARTGEPSPSRTVWILPSLRFLRENSGKGLTLDNSSSSRGTPHHGNRRSPDSSFCIGELVVTTILAMGGSSFFDKETFSPSLIGESCVGCICGSALTGFIEDSSMANRLVKAIFSCFNCTISARSLRMAAFFRKSDFRISPMVSRNFAIWILFAESSLKIHSYFFFHESIVALAVCIVLSASIF